MTSWFETVAYTDDLQSVSDGIWRSCSRVPDQFFAEYLPDVFLEELSLGKEVGWKEAVERALPLLDRYAAQYTRDYFSSTYRSDLIGALPIGPGSLVLDLGCGWGFASQRCLEKGAMVVGADMSSKRLEFCRTRLGQEGFSARFVGVEVDVGATFPFKPSTCDVVILSGLLEWVACSNPGAPEKIQHELLRRCSETLKQGGILYLAIENRFWWRYFIGARDLHTLQRFTSILPRRLARSLSLLWSGTDYRAYTYSFWAYVGLLKKLGFRSFDVIYPEPDYVQPRKTTSLLCNFRLDRPMNIIRKQFWNQSANKWLNLFGRSFVFVALK